VNQEAREAARRGAFVCSATDFADVIYVMKMIRARAILRENRLMVVRGNQRREDQIEFYGTQLQYLPETVWRETWEQTSPCEAVMAMAQQYLEAATDLAGPTKEDVLNAVRCYVSARRLLKREACDAVTMNCLGAVGVGMAFPCLAFSRLLDGDADVLDLYGDRGITRRWGHHTLFYGNRRRELRAFCRLFGIEPICPQQPS
jgi:hypothetical protein